MVRFGSPLFAASSSPSMRRFGKWQRQIHLLVAVSAPGWSRAGERGFSCSTPVALDWTDSGMEKGIVHTAVRCGATFGRRDCVMGRSRAWVSGKRPLISGTGEV
uniref:Uncharacterized protein n=1 Tax=Arundo donax TaxID=35708 RepID=A0A0A9HJL1_ARUDO